jgi:2'-5' RNA ligase
MDIRCFISINLDEYTQKKVGDIIDVLNKYEADIKWVNPENLHLTLKFLGNTPEERLNLIKEALENVASKYHPFYTKIKGMGVFPNKRYPRVLWVGVENKEILIEIQRQVETEMSFIGYKKEQKEFSPHVTIGRARSSFRVQNVLECLDSYKDYDFGILCVKNIYIMRSDLNPKGPKYTKLYEISLK